MRDILGHHGEQPEPELELEQEQPEHEIFHHLEEVKKSPAKKSRSPSKKTAEEPRSAKPTPSRVPASEKKSAAKSTSKRSVKKGSKAALAEPEPIEEQLEAMEEEIVPQQIEVAESAEPEPVIGLPSVAY